jgi:hypothetical protein
VPGAHATTVRGGDYDKTFWESFKAEGENVVDKVKQIVHEGNVRRVVVKHDGRTVAEFPLTAGVVGAVLAPVLAAIGALVALMKDCTIEMERTRNESAPESEPVPVAVGSGERAEGSRQEF